MSKKNKFTAEVDTTNLVNINPVKANDLRNLANKFNSTPKKKKVVSSKKLAKNPQALMAKATAGNKKAVLAAEKARAEYLASPEYLAKQAKKGQKNESK